MIGLKKEMQTMQKLKMWKVMVLKLCYLLSCVLICNASMVRKKWPPMFVFGRPYGGFLNHPVLRGNLNAREAYSDVKTEWIDQRVDHFNASDTRTYKQRYMVNMQFYNNSGIVFLMVGGESAISKTWIGNTNYTWLVWARKFGAACFQLEHRYFGESHPMPNITTASYRYFTIEQALADLRYFVLQMNEKHFSNFKKPKWVVFGGSYPGALAAWFREKNEDITTAAIASSAGVQPRVDYYDYVENVEKTFRTVSPQCADAVKEGMKSAIQKIYNVDGRIELARLFDVCTPFPNQTQPVNIQYFLANIMYYFEGITQYTGDNRDLQRKEGLGVPGACTILNNASIGDPLKRIKAVIDWYNSFYYGKQCFGNDYASAIFWYRKTKYDPPNFERAAARGWMWLCCTQIGLMQTTDGGRGMFGSIVPLDFYANQCMEIFGENYDADYIRKAVWKTFFEYGGYYNYTGTRVVFADGSFDPWVSICYQGQDPEREVYSVIVKGGAHCCDMYPANATSDSKSLKEARAFMLEKLTSFLNNSTVETKSTSRSTAPAPIKSTSRIFTTTPVETTSRSFTPTPTETTSSSATTTESRTVSHTPLTSAPTPGLTDVHSFPPFPLSTATTEVTTNAHNVTTIAEVTTTTNAHNVTTIAEVTSTVHKFTPTATPRPKSAPTSCSSAQFAIALLALIKLIQ